MLHSTNEAPPSLGLPGLSCLLLGGLFGVLGLPFLFERPAGLLSLAGRS